MPTPSKQPYLVYSVKTFRDAGLEVTWSKNRRGAPIILARDPNGEHEHQRKEWWAVDKKLWEAMHVEGVREAFNRLTLLGDIFSIKA